MKINLQSISLKYFLLCSVFALFSAKTIAQTWSYRAGYGSSAAGTERGTAMDMDAAGNVYITGTFAAGNLDFGTGALTNANGSDGFVAKFNSAGTCQWAIRIGSDITQLTQGTSIVTDGTSVYIAGNFFGNMTVGSSPTTYTSTGVGDGFVIKLAASNGATSWVTTYGGSSVDNTHSICLDGAGSPYISGSFFTSATFGAAGVRNANGGSSDIFVGKLNATTGAFTWVSTGGAVGSTDNPGGSNLCYVPALDEVVMAGSYNVVAGTTTGVTYGSVNLPFTNAGNEICLLEINAATGAFISGTAVTGTGNDEALGICYDASTQDVFITGYFGANINFGGGVTLNNGNGNNDGFYARYNPSANTFTWAQATSSTAGSDRCMDIASNGSGALYITGYFNGNGSVLTVNGFNTPLTVTNNRTTGDEIFLLRVRAEDGDGQLLTKSTGDNTTGVSNQGYSVAVRTGNAWILGSYGSPVTFSPLATLPLVGPAGGADIVLARFTDPAPLTSTQSQTGITCNIGCNATATVTPSGGVTPYTYAWSPSGGTAATATGLCPGNYTVTVTDAIGNTSTQNYTIAQPATPLATATTSNLNFPVSANNNIIADAGCNLIARLLPNGAVPVSGNVSGRVWIEGSVPVFGGQPFVQRHYEITPATNTSTATGRVTLYFTQAEFNNFNAHPGSILDLPTGPGDAAGIANLRVGKYPGSTNNGTGLPGSYTSQPVLLNPVDANITWNAGQSRWEVILDVVGFSGFIVQTSTFILPVHLTSFSGQLAGQDVQLKWTAESEVSHDYYEVERSTDGRNFTAIGRRNGTNAGGVSNYALTDAGAATQNAGKLYYRLKIVSLSGGVEYSDLVIIYLDQQNRWLTGVLPNPFTEKINLSFNAPRTGKAIIKVIDMAGKVVSQQSNEIVKGFSTIAVQNLGRLSHGVYTLLVEYDGQQVSYKVVK